MPVGSDWCNVWASQRKHGDFSAAGTSALCFCVSSDPPTRMSFSKRTKTATTYANVWQYGRTTCTYEVCPCSISIPPLKAQVTNTEKPNADQWLPTKTVKNAQHDSISPCKQGHKKIQHFHNICCLRASHLAKADQTSFCVLTHAKVPMSSL